MDEVVASGTSQIQNKPEEGEILEKSLDGGCARTDLPKPTASTGHGQAMVSRIRPFGFALA